MPAVDGDTGRQFWIGPQYRELFLQLRNAAVEHHVVHIHQAQRTIFGVTLVECQQHTATRHGFEILDHEFAHADIGTDEKANPVERGAILFARLGAGHEQCFYPAQLVEQRLASTVGNTVGAADECQLDVPLAALILQQALIIALGYEHCIEAFFAQPFADHEARTDHPRPRQFAVVCAEFAGVLAGDVILVGVMLQDHQIGHCADESNLANFLLEP